MEDISPDVLALARVLIASGLAGRPAPGGETAECSARPPWTVPEAAAHLKVHESTLYRAIQDGYLIAYSVGSGGRAIRIPATELDAFKACRMIRRAAGGPRAASGAVA